jgi:hypothetical protein
MATHMKTTIELSDNLLSRAKDRARAQKITLRFLIEKSLSTTLEEPLPPAKVRPVTFKGKGLSHEFEGASWDKIRDTIYP